jgi:hypothetical protein
MIEIPHVTGMPRSKDLNIPGKHCKTLEFQLSKSSPFKAWFLILLLGACAPEAAKKNPYADICQRVNEMEASGQFDEHRILPTGSDEVSATYRFERLEGKGSAEITGISASCGNGSYSECQIQVRSTKGKTYSFVDLSRFSLLDIDGEYYLVYRIINPKNAVQQRKRRVVKVDDPPKTMCNQIGDYSDLM